MGEMGASGTAENRPRWKQDPDAVRADILRVALQEFAANGLSGARIDEIAAKTATSKRMIYYYFGDKDGLYRHVLEAAYREMRSGEDELQLAGLPPVEALVRLVEFTFDHHRANPEFIRLVMIENIHHGDCLKQSDIIRELNLPAVSHLEDICRRGVEEGVFREDVSALELHWMVSALSFFNVSNRPTFSLIFGDSIFTDTSQDSLCSRFSAMVVGSVLKDGSPAALKKSHTRPAIARSGKSMMNPQLKAFLDTWDAQWATLKPGATPADRRDHFEGVARNMRLPTPADITTDAEHWVETEGGPVRVRIFRHASGGAQPALIYMHGGGWMQGSPETHWDITSRLASWNRQTVISVDYALAPEHPFPKAVNQCAGVAKWAHANAGELGLDPARISVGGDSAGGNIAAAIALKLRSSDVPVMAQLLIYPAVEFTQSRPSFRENADGPIIKVASMPVTNAMYCPNPDDLNHPFAAPMMAKDKSGLPKAYVAVAQYDPLRDDGIAYAEALDAAGVPVVLDRGTGLIHGYLRAMDFCTASHESLERMAQWLATCNREAAANG